MICGERSRQVWLGSGCVLKLLKSCSIASAGAWAESSVSTNVTISWTRCARPSLVTMGGSYISLGPLSEAPGRRHMERGLVSIEGLGVSPVDNRTVPAEARASVGMRRCRWKKVSVWLWSGVQFGLWPTVSRGKVRGWLLRDVNWPQSKQGGPVRPPRGGPPYRATGERSNYIGPQAIVHWQSGGSRGLFGPEQCGKS
jgi:hypothetical protein